MGGNALKDCVTRRYTANEYYELEFKVLWNLYKLFPQYMCVPIKSYTNKESFGDMDILISSEFIREDMIEDIIDVFQPKSVYKNGNCLSFEYKEFQIDLIATGEDNYQSSQYYFAYNDLGNLCGRLAHSIGLKLGHDGLSYNYMEGTNLVKNIMLSKDWEEILPVLGLSYERYEEGFDNIEDIFEFVCSSTLFRKDIYLLENRNHTSRVRDSKRKTYMLFLEWLESPSYNGREGTKRASKDLWLPYIHYNVKGFTEAYLQAQEELKNAKEFNRRFNGGLVRNLTGVEGKALGEFMKWIKEYYGGADKLQRDILKMNSNCVHSWIVHVWKKYTNTLDIADFRA